MTRATNGGTNGRIHRAAALVASGIDGISGVAALLLVVLGSRRRPGSVCAGRLSGTSARACLCSRQAIGLLPGWRPQLRRRSADTCLPPLARRYASDEARTGRVERFDDSTALLLAVDFGLGLDGKARLGELMLGPHDFGGAANLGPLDRDRGVGLQLSAFTLSRDAAGVAIVGCLTAPQLQNQRQQVQQARRTRPSASAAPTRLRWRVSDRSWRPTARPGHDPHRRPRRGVPGEGLLVMRRPWRPGRVPGGREPPTRCPAHAAHRREARSPFVFRALDRERR